MATLGSVAALAGAQQGLGAEQQLTVPDQATTAVAIDARLSDHEGS